ncbi:hypothetical protein [Lysobacter enzymogenes]|uniref:hypothetical protein n=1 Tax=Lysobacter enzymogenes TaxID=69 RepID=UPI002264022F|nr:hypothetical protein [Lysobacter enzymogenes]UZW62445.1 hypothetical protein BV903_009195 [Lysobacter enzymogenes]
MKRTINGLLLAFFIIYSAACQKQGVAEAATEGITVGETRANVELLLKSRGIKFEFSPPLDDTSTLSAELIEEEALKSPTLFFLFPSRRLMQSRKRLELSLCSIRMTALLE